LKAIQADFWHSSIDTKTLINYFNKKLDRDLNAFFYQYLQTIDIPVLTIQKTDSQGFKYKWSKSIDSFNLSLKLTDDKLLQPTTTWNTETTYSVNSQIVKELEGKYLIKVKWQ
jgi:aminopeptidase N